MKDKGLRFGLAPLVLAVIAFLAAGYLLWATPDGPAVQPDSVAYLSGARNIAEGKGFVYGVPPGPITPVTHYPPGYPLAVAAADLAAGGGDVFRGSRVASLILFGAGVWLAGMLVWLASSRNLPAAILSSVLYAVNPVMLDLHGAAISECLFLPLTLLCVILTAQSIESRRPWAFVIAGLSAGLAAGTRFPGMVWVGATPLVILLSFGRDWKAGLKASILAGLAAAFPVALTIARNKLVGDSATNRELAFHLVSRAHIAEALSTMASWLLPWRFSNWISGMFIALLIGAVLFIPAFLALRGKESSAGLKRGFLLTIGVFSALYLAHLPVAITLLDYAVQMDSRILAPIQIILLCALTLLVVRLRHPAWGYAAVLILVAFYGRQSLVVARKTRIAGSGYRSRGWYANPAVQAISALPKDAQIWANKPEGIYISLDRPVNGLPAAKDSGSLKPNAEAPAQFAAISREAAKTPSYLIFFHPRKDDLTFNVDGKVVSLDRLQEFSLEDVKSMLKLKELVAGPEVDFFAIEAAPAVGSTAEAK